METHNHVHQHVHKTEHPDSVEIGTAGKGGGIKVYHTASDAKGFKEKIDAMKDILDHAQKKFGVVANEKA